MERLCRLHGLGIITIVVLPIVSCSQTEKYYDNAHKEYLSHLQYMETLEKPEDIEKAKEKLITLGKIREETREDMTKSRETSSMFWSAMIALVTSGLHIVASKKT